MWLFFLTMGDPAPVKRPIDEDWISRIAVGDMEALQRLYAAVSDSVYSFALSLVRDPHDAEDVLQESFLRICRAAADYRPQGKPLAWVFTIVRHTAMDKHRQTARTLPVEEVAVDVSDVADADDRLFLHALLNRLSAEDRQILILHVAAGLKHREIAAVMAMPLGTVLSRYRRALNRLKTIAKEESLYDQQAM